MAAYTIALSKARCSPLSQEEQVSTGCNVRWRLLTADVAYATATATDDVLTFTLGSTPSNWIINRALANVTTAFAGSTGTATLAVGTTSSVAALVSAQDIKVAGPLEMVSTVPIGTNAQGTASLSIVATATQNTGGSFSVVTSGQVDIYLNVVNLDQVYSK